MLRHSASKDTLRISGNPGDADPLSHCQSLHGYAFLFLLFVVSCQRQITSIVGLCAVFFLSCPSRCIIGPSLFLSCVFWVIVRPRTPLYDPRRVRPLRAIIRRQRRRHSARHNNNTCSRTNTFPTCWKSADRIVPITCNWRPMPSEMVSARTVDPRRP